MLAGRHILRLSFEGVRKHVNRRSVRLDPSLQLHEIGVTEIAAPGDHARLQAHQVVPGTPRIGERIKQDRALALTRHLKRSRKHHSNLRAWCIWSSRLGRRDGSTVFVIGVFLVSTLVAGALYQFIEARRSMRAYAPPGRVVDVEGQRLHLLCAGSGSPTVVFESGIAASSLSWTRVLPGVATFTRACAYDRAGLAWSDPPRSPRTLARIIGELHALLANAAVPGPFVFVGHSFGAFLVCAYASQHPTDTAGIVLVDPPSEWHQPTR